VQLKNETKYEEMIDIILNLHKYVPSKSVSKAVQVEESEYTSEEKQLYPLLFGGDQLSVATYRGSRHSSTNSVVRLEGLWPVVEDWHTVL